MFVLVFRLIKLLEDIMDGSRLLIFMETKRGCDQVTRQLRLDGWPALSIHGDKSQAERDWVLSEFKAGKSPIMTATDVAARGLGMFRKSFFLRNCVITFWNETSHSFSVSGVRLCMFFNFTSLSSSQISILVIVWGSNRVLYIPGLPRTSGKFWVTHYVLSLLVS